MSVTTRTRGKAPAATTAKSRKKGTLDRIISRVQAASKKDADKGTIEISRSNANILSSVQYVLKTGIDAFDEPVGGFPFGRVVELYGLESCGKTAMCIRATIQAQLGNVHVKEVDPDDPDKVLWRRIDPEVDKVDVNIVFIDNEQSIEDDEKVEFLNPDTGKKVEIDCAIARCDTVDDLFKITDTVVKEVAAVQEETGRMQLTLVVIDTIAGTASKEELAQAWDKDDYPRQPKQLRKGFRRMIRKLNKHNCLMLCTNQVSDRFKSALESMQRKNTLTPQAADFDTFGGRALKFYASIRIFMYRMTAGFKLYKGQQFDPGLLIGFCTPKNRLRPPLREARLVILFDGGLSDLFSKLETLKFLKLAEVSQTGLTSFKFAKAGVEVSTFNTDPGESLEDADLAPRRKSSRSTVKADFQIANRGEWPSYYAEHKRDLDALWEVGKKRLFEIETSISADHSDESVDDELDEDDD